MPPDRRTGAVALLAALLLLGHAAFLARQQGPACIDDAYISFRYARNLAEGQGLVFNPGERVEGYTNFGWTILLAGVHAAGLPVPPVARLLSALAGAALVVLALHGLASRALVPGLAVPLAGLLLAADGSLARWSQDGMETVLFAMLLLAGALRAAAWAQGGRRFPFWAVAFAAASLVRPEGVLWFGASALLLIRPAGLRRTLTAAGVFCLLYLPYFLWRWIYYGSLLPNTFHAKVGGTPAQVGRGAAYAWNFLIVDRWPLLLLLGLSGWLLVRRRADGPAWRRYLAAPAAAHVAYVILVGGDWMGPGRFLVPAVPALYVLLADAGAGFLDRARPAAAALAVGALIAAQFALTSWISERRSVQAERPFSESRLTIARWLRANAGAGDTLLSNEIGQLAYVSGLPTHDLHGLTDPHIARLEMKGMGEGRAGHEKADLEYSFSRRPTWVVIPGIAADYMRRRGEFPPYEDYALFLLPQTTPRPDYQVLLRRAEDRR